MIWNIQQTVLKLTYFLGLFAFLTSCNASTANHLSEYKKVKLKIENKLELIIYIAQTDAEQKRGLSGIKQNDFSLNQGMLFPKDEMDYRQFWMPNTYFDLDLFFMNSDFYILDVHRRLKHFPHEGPKNNIPLSKTVFSQHVLEIRSDSPVAKILKPGMKIELK